MSARGSQGYILASAIGVLLTISIVAATLVGTSGDARLRLQRSEAEAIENTILQSALTLLGSQLPLDPRRRTLDLTGDVKLAVMERDVQARVRWESNKLDINRADPGAVERLLKDRRVSTRTITALLSGLDRMRNENRRIRLMSDLSLDDQDEACVESMLTVFGGRTDYDPGNPGDQTLIGRPAAGSRLSIELFVPQPARAGLRAVVLMTGDALRPMEVLDWKRTTGPVGEEVCHDAQ